MMNVCPNCGAHEVEKTIDPSGPFALCSACHYAQPFLQLPLFFLTGASGTGKSTLCFELVSRLRRECVVLETDIIWGVTPIPTDSYQNMWLRLAKNIGQTGSPVVLCGTVLPEWVESCVERRYFSDLHFLALVCDDETLRDRLLQRPTWRETHSESFLKQSSGFNRWLKENAARTAPPMTLYDTGEKSLEKTTDNVVQWIRERL
jgi:2-phosphoglycerate kinase